MEKKRIGFIGTGVMGASMAGHLVDAGHDVVVFNRTRARAKGVVEKGASWADSAGQAARDADLVLSIVGFPTDVEEIYFGEGGILENVRSGSVLIDLTTSRPDLAVKIAAAARGRECAALDAPVSGGDVGARDARLTIMVGGDQEVFDSALPILEIMGANIVLQGGAGSGQHAKMCNQIAIASGMLSVCESLAYAEKSGLDPTKMLSSISSGAAGSWSLTNLAPRIVAGNFDPGFYVKHFIKDLNIAVNSAAEMGLELPGLALAKEMYDRLAAAGGEDLGTQGLFKLYSSSM